MNRTTREDQASMSNYATRREQLETEVCARLQTELGPHTRRLLEHALESLPQESPLFLEALEEHLAMAPERLERELRNLHNARSG